MNGTKHLWHSIKRKVVIRLPSRLLLSSMPSLLTLFLSTPWISIEEGNLRQHKLSTGEYEEDFKVRSYSFSDCVCIRLKGALNPLSLWSGKHSLLLSSGFQRWDEFNSPQRVWLTARNDISQLLPLTLHLPPYCGTWQVQQTPLPVTHLHTKWWNK